jgi:hypothetical protein
MAMSAHVVHFTGKRSHSAFSGIDSPGVDGKRESTRPMKRYRMSFDHDERDRTCHEGWRSNEARGSSLIALFGPPCESSATSGRGRTRLLCTEAIRGDVVEAKCNEHTALGGGHGDHALSRGHVPVRQSPELDPDCTPLESAFDPATPNGGPEAYHSGRTVLDHNVERNAGSQLFRMSLPCGQGRWRYCLLM